VKNGALTTRRHNYFLHNRSRNDNDWIEISSNNLSEEDISKLYQPHSFHPRQPQYYPWYNHTAGPLPQWNFKLFWKTVHQPDPKSNIPSYIVHNEISTADVNSKIYSSATGILTVHEFCSLKIPLYLH
jgi:uncharacterized protein (DUF2126 family)